MYDYRTFIFIVSYSVLVFFLLHTGEDVKYKLEIGFVYCIKN